MRIERDNGLSALIASTTERQLCTGFEFTEGPVWVSDDNCLLFSDIPNNRIHRWRPGSEEAEVYRDPSGHANGLTLDHSGNVLACEHSNRRVSRGPYDGPAETVVDRYEGKRFNNPNDIIVHSSGAIYFTDPWLGALNQRMGDPNAVQELGFQGVYRVAPDGSLSCLDDTFTTPNGLALSPDESFLYVDDSREKTVRRFQVNPDGTLDGGEVIVDMNGIEGRGVPDGMKVDEAGRLWITGVAGVWVTEADGTLLGILQIEEHAANLTFGGPEFTTLFLTAETSVYELETNVRGIAPGSRS